MSKTHESTDTHGVDVSHIDVIPPSDRHGQPRDLFQVWFFGNLSIGNAIFGALAIAVGLACAVSVAAALPFVSNGWYAGTMAGWTEGADISWIPGILVTGAVYLLITRFAGASQTSPDRALTAHATRPIG
jgi:purine-cytosine permease-like protein